MNEIRCLCVCVNVKLLVVKPSYVEKKVHGENFSLNGESTGNFLENNLK